MKKRGNISNLIMKPNRLPHLPKIAGVYKITDHTNNKCYVGSSENVNTRCAQYLCTNNTHPKGMDFNNITFELLENCKYLTLDQRLQVELECIIKHNTIHPNGFNKQNPVTMSSFNPHPLKSVKPVSKLKKTAKHKQSTNYGKSAKSYVNIMTF